ncbi:RdRp [Atrato Rhabdo-like virus 3]|uniref:Replicase n=1 Tax=Atrato Rhabdo-like virus 3 TaxID=2689335 RepID=A0A6B9KFX4_9RHAB|nr:RdRp [Atrato Rhabdo-like virus 3]
MIDLEKLKDKYINSHSTSTSSSDTHLNLNMDDDDNYEAPLPPMATHCNSPLKTTNARAALGRPEIGQYIPRNSRPKTEWAAIREIASFRHIDCFTSALHQSFLLNDLGIEPKTLWDEEWARQHTVSKELWRLNVSVLNSTGNTNLSPDAPNYTQEEAALLRRLYTKRCFWEEIVLLTGSDHADQGLYWTPTHLTGLYTCVIGKVTMFAGKSIFFVHTSRGNSLLSRDHMVMISDLASQRYILHQAVILDSHLRRGSLSLDHLQRLIRNGDDMLTFGGNNAFSLIYTLEPSCVSRLTGDIPIGSRDGKTFRQTMLMDFYTKAQKLDLVDLLQERESLLDEIAQNHHHLSQCYGLYRIWGHPTVNPVSGASALRAIATNVRKIHHDEAIEISNKFKEEFVKRFFAQKKAWPPLDISALGPSNVIRIAMEKLAAVPIDNSRYRRADWNLVSFNKCFEVDPKFELLEVLSDKALSLDTDVLIESLKAGKGAGNGLQRSVILNWLNSDLSDPKQLLDMVNEFGFPAKQNSSFGLREKEREGKIVARMFGLATLLKRMYIVLTEALLAEHILPFFPEITMTDDEISLDKKRYTFTKSRGRCFHLFTSLDFSKWNTNMREEETLPLFTSFDQMFGFTAVFSRTHEMFSTSFMYLLNGSYTPLYDPQTGTFIPQVGSWFGHLGGIEGLRQKGWTIWTVILILLCAEGCGMILKLMGQGDNQILRQTFPHHYTHEQCMDSHYRFLNNLNQKLRKIGPPLKLEETWTSPDLFIYGKYIIHRETPLETSYKRLCRMFRMSNEDFPTLESAVSSMTANVSSALACSTAPGSEFLVYTSELTGLFQLFLRVPYLQRVSPIRTLSLPKKVMIPPGQSLHISEIPLLSLLGKDQFFINLLMLPRSFGGYPIQSLPQLLVRGFPDDPTFCASFLKRAYQFASSNSKKYITHILSPVINPNVSLQLILEHPTALNLLTPPAPGESRRSVIVDYLSTDFSCKNTYFKEFMKVLRTDVDKVLCEFLGACVPFNPVVLGAFADATVTSRARKVAGKLQKTRTMAKVIQQQAQIDLYSRVIEAEENHLRCVLNTVVFPGEGTVTWHPDKCSLAHVQEIRDRGWQRPVVGVDCVPPIEFMTMESNGPITQCSTIHELDKGYISMQIPQAMTIDELCNQSCPGPYTPYRGSTTKQRVTGYGAAVAHYTSPLLSKIASLSVLPGWAIPLDGILHQLLGGLMLSITDLSFDGLIARDAVISGSVHHRLEDDRIDKGGAVSLLPNYGTKFLINTLPLHAYSRGSQNVNLMFQSPMTYAVAIKSMEMKYRRSGPIENTHIHVRNSCCVRKINEELIESTVPIPQNLRFTRYEGNPFLFISRERAIKSEIGPALNPAAAERTSDPPVIRQRLIALAAYKIFEIIEPPNWTTKILVHSKTGFLINWAFRLPILETLEVVALLLLTYHSCNIREEETPGEYIARIKEMVQRSPTDCWLGLSNLLFCPNIHHELCRAPYYTSISGNPEMTETLLSSNIKAGVLRILTHWTDPKDRSRLSDITIWAPIDCGVMLHPAIVTMVRDWILYNNISNPSRTRQLIVGTLQMQRFKRPKGYNCGYAETCVMRGDRRIVPETLDGLCKMAPPLQSKVSTLPPPGISDLPKAHSILGAFHRSDVHPLTEDYVVVPKRGGHTYISHANKPVAAPTSGPYKGLSLLTEVDGLKITKALITGDGGGGFTLSAGLACPFSSLYFNTLISTTETIQQTAPIPYLPSLAGFPEIELRLRNLDLANDNISNLKDLRFPLMFSTKCSRSVDLMMCDAECFNYLEGREPLDLANGVVRIAHHLQADHLFMKTYALNQTVLRHQISILLSYYAKVSVIRCYFSGEANTEVYLYAERPSRVLEFKIMDDSIQGHLLFSPKFTSIMEALANFQVPYMGDFIGVYSSLIHPDWAESAKKDLYHYIPKFVFDRLECHYTTDSLGWLQTTMKRRERKLVTSRAPGETTKFTPQLITRIMITLIVHWLAVDPTHVALFEHFANDISLYWYRTLNKGWWMVLSHRDLQAHDARQLKKWPLVAHLRSKHFKLIHRLRGIWGITRCRAIGFRGLLESVTPSRRNQVPSDKTLRNLLLNPPVLSLPLE